MRQIAPEGPLARRTLRSTVAATVLVMAFICVGSIAQARADCAYQGINPSQISTMEARYAVWCLINEQRSANGLPALAASPELGRAAQRHSRAMNRRNFFGHLGDGSPASRARRAGYTKNRSFWTLGEALEWGRGKLGTPAHAMSAIMGSPIHRAEILDARYRDVGVGVAKGSPRGRGGRNAAIYTVDLGARR